jgi:hypothetical protein
MLMAMNFQDTSATISPDFKRSSPKEALMCGGSTMMEVNSYIIDIIYQNYLKTM